MPSTLDGLLLHLVSLYTLSEYLDLNQIPCTSILIDRVANRSNECVLNIHGQTDRPGHLSKTVSECRCFVFRCIIFGLDERRFIENGAVPLCSDFLEQW